MVASLGAQVYRLWLVLQHKNSCVDVPTGALKLREGVGVEWEHLYGCF